MTGGLTLAFTIIPLFLIFGFLVVRGVAAIEWALPTQLPAPVGQEGGGMANALYGSAMLVGLATLFAVPVGLLAAIYLAEYRSDRLEPAVRFVGELLGGAPSIVIGMFAATLFLPVTHHPSGWAGSFALVAAADNPRVPTEVVLACQLVMGPGTLLGGWRIVKTMGQRVIRLRPVHGFCAETAAAATLAMTVFGGIPVSTTHTITGTLVGVGLLKRTALVRWVMAREIVWAWVLTIPGTAIMAALFLSVLRLLP